MKLIRHLALALSVVVLTAAAEAQTPFATGLQFPSKVIFTPRGQLLVAENGTGPNNGRVSVVDRITGERRTLLAGLPSAINSAEGEPTPSGPSGLFLDGNTLYLLIAEGDSVLAGPVAGSTRANPSPTSPLLSSLMRVTFGGPVDQLTGDLALTPADHATIRSGQPVTVGSGTNSATFRLIADFPNYTSEPRPDFFANVRHSDPYGVVVRGGFAYVADAGQNAILKVDLATGTTTTLTQFAATANTTGVGGPTIEAVPDSIRLDGDRLLVTLLSGFPFAPGVSRIVSVDTAGGTSAPAIVPSPSVVTVIDGLTTAIDAVPVTTDKGRQYVIAEFSTNLLAGTPGRILVATDNTHKNAIAAIASPSSLAVDARTSEIFAVQIFPGTVTRIDASGVLGTTTATSIIPVVASVAGAFGSRFETSLQLTNPYDYTISGVVRLRGADTTKDIAYQLAPNQTRSIDNLLASQGMTGGATADIEAGVGPAPIAVARIYDTSRSAASTGAVIVQVSPDDALQAGERAVLIAASDPAVARTNIGVRPLGAGATLDLSLRRSDGTLVTTVEKSYPANQLTQQSIAEIFGANAAASDSIVIEVKSGAAIVYAATVNNTTQEASYQRAVRTNP